VIVLCGIESETAVATVAAALEDLDARYVMLHQRHFRRDTIDLELVAGQLRGTLAIGEVRMNCAEVTGVYTRMMDWRFLPEMKDADAALRARCQRWHDTVYHWIEMSPGVVMNRATAGVSNTSKPFQAQLIRAAGFSIPETLITNDAALVRAFHAEHQRVVYKSISGVRSIVREIDDEALRRLHLLRWCPVQFQRYIAGTNIRVHTVAGEVFATRIDTDRVDYRYAHRDGGYAHLTACTLPDDVAQRCLDLAQDLGLALAGLDLIRCDDGEFFCLEVNPSPAFTYYADGSGQPIARAIASALTTH
jgi:glutathione synthase/RimK-type ligase-like ATP-grasp enzyme